MKLKSIELETAIKKKLCKLLEQLNQRHNVAETVTDFVEECNVDSEEQDLYTQFLQVQNIQIIDLQEHFQRYCIVLPVFRFNSAKYDLNLIKSHLLPIFVDERDVETIVKKEADQFVSSNFCDIQLLDIMNFLDGATSLNYFLKAYKNNETKGFCYYECLNCTEKLSKKGPSLYEFFFNILRNSDPLEKDYNDFKNFVQSGLSGEQALAKLKMDNALPTQA